MRVPTDADIPMEKLTRYLLAPRMRDDKSKFLSQAGLDQTNPDMLLRAIRDHAALHAAFPDGDNEYGDFYRVDGGLLGPNGITIQVATVWIRWHIDASTHFVKRKPLRRDGP